MLQFCILINQFLINFSLVVTSKYGLGSSFIGGVLIALQVAILIFALKVPPPSHPLPSRALCTRLWERDNQGTITLRVGALSRHH